MPDTHAQWQPDDPVARLLSDAIASRDEADWPEVVEQLCRERPELAGRLRELFARMRASGLVAAPASHADQRFGNYRLVRRLGAGGMGVVWEADQSSTGRKVALKLIRAELLESEGAHRRFRREVELAASLDHANICTVYEAGSVDGQPFLAMQLVQGESLSGLVSHGSLPAERAVVIAERLAHALHAAHRAGLVHRDVKPANVILRDDGEPVLLDFGLARSIDHESAALTMTGDIVGTPAYLAPEQIEPGVGPIDARTDVYGLGITLHELVTGLVPFAAPTRDALYRRILTGDRQRTSLAATRLPRDLQAIIETAIDHEPSRRYASALEFANDLARLRKHEPVRARRAGPLLRLLRWSQRNRAAAALLLGLSFALLAVLWSLRQASASLADSHQRQLVLASVEAMRADPMLALHLARVAVDRRADFAAVTQLAAAVRSTMEELHLDLPFQGGAKEVVPTPGGGFWARGTDASDAPIAKLVLWRSELGLREIATPVPVVDVAVDATGGRCVIVGSDGGVRELAPDQLTWRDIVHDRDVSLACFSRAGNLVLADAAGSLVLVGRDGQVRPVAVQADVVITALEAHPGRDLLLVGTAAGGLFAVDEGTGALHEWSILQADQPRQGVSAIRCAVQSHWIAAQSRSARHIAAVDLEAPTSPARHFGGLRRNDPIYCFAIVGNRLVTGHRNQVVQLHDLVSNATTTLTGPTSWVYRLHAAADGSLLAGGCADGTILTWDLGTGKVMHRVRGAGRGPSCVVLDPSSNRVLVALQIGPLRAYSLRREDAPRLRGHEAGVRCCLALPAGSSLSMVTWAADGTARGWDGSFVPMPLAGTGNELVTSATPLPGGGGLAAIDSKGRLQCWSDAGAPAGDPLLIEGAGETWTAMAALGADRLLVNSSAPKHPRRLWHLVRDGHTWQEMALPEGLPDPATVWGVTSSPDGREILLGHGDGTATHLSFDGIAFTVLQPLAHQQGSDAQQSLVQKLAIASDCQRLLTSGNDRIAKLWDRDGRLVATLAGHEEIPVHVAFSPDGRHIATVSADEVWLWDRDGRPVFRIQSDGGAFSNCAFLADNRRLAITSTDGSVWVEPVLLGDLVAEASRRQTRAIAPEVLAPYTELLATEGPMAPGR